MTDDEARIVHYLRAFAGQRVQYCRMLNFLADQMVGYVRGINKVPKSERRAAWARLQNATNSLVRDGIVIRHRTRGRRYPTVRLNEAFV